MAGAPPGYGSQELFRERVIDALSNRVLLGTDSLGNVACYLKFSRVQITDEIIRKAALLAPLPIPSYEPCIGWVSGFVPYPLKGFIKPPVYLILVDDVGGLVYESPPPRR